MIYTIEKRTGKDGGGLTSWYEVRQYDSISRLGILMNGQTIADFDTKKDAKAFCTTNNIKCVEDTSSKGCRW